MPRLGQAEEVAGLACPDCTGTLTVRVEGSAGHLHFRCRVGHSYGLGSLLAAKEEAVDQRLWSALVSLEELAFRAVIDRNTPIDLGLDAGRQADSPC